MSTATKARREKRVPTHPDWLYLLSQGVTHPDLCFVTSMAVGHLVMLASVGNCYVRGEGYLCEWHEWEARDGRPVNHSTKGERFWDWWCRRAESVQDTPERACVAYVIAYRAWVEKYPEKP